jgi:hypothetical protein
MRRPTLRQDGQKRTTLYVDFHLSGWELAAALALSSYDQVTEFGDHPEARITQAAAEKRIREHLAYEGFGVLGYWQEKQGDSYRDAWAWAVRELRRLFPEQAAGLTDEPA